MSEMNDKELKMYQVLARDIKDKIDCGYVWDASVRLILSENQISVLKKAGFEVTKLCKSYLEGSYECKVSWLHPVAGSQAELIFAYMLN